MTLTILGGDKSLTTKGINVVRSVIYDKSPDIILYGDSAGINSELNKLINDEFPKIILCRTELCNTTIKKTMKHKLLSYLSDIIVLFPGASNINVITNIASKSSRVLIDHTDKKQYVY